jgi:hypothetical protein
VTRCQSRTVPSFDLSLPLPDRNLGKHSRPARRRRPGAALLSQSAARPRPAASASTIPMALGAQWLDLGAASSPPGPTTAPIFDDAVYHSEALLLPVTENEDDLDSQLALAARESGVEDPYRILSPDAHLISTSMSMTSLHSEQRSSMSIHSRETQSTSFTSPTSRTSRDHPYLDQPPVLRSPPSLARASLSQDHDSAPDYFLPSIRHRHSSSGFSAANSILSTTSSARKPKHKRGSGLFSIFRRDSRCVCQW